MKPADTCEVISHPVTATYIESSYNEGEDEKKNQKSIEEKVTIPIAMCGVHGVFELPEDKVYTEITKYSKKFLTIVYPHMGKEYVPKPDQIKTDVYRKLIDSGADIVIGDHPHITQSTEVYKNKLIIYSLGNSIFDQQYSPNVTEAIALETSYNFLINDNIRYYIHT